MATKSSFNGDVILKILVGVLFLIIGIEGVGDFGSNELYREFDRTFDIILGVILICAGLLVFVPMFVSGIKSSFTKISSLIVLVVWVVFIILADFVNGLSGVNGTEWFTWLEELIYHLLILASVLKVAMPAVRKLGN